MGHLVDVPTSLYRSLVFTGCGFKFLATDFLGFSGLANCTIPLQPLSLVCAVSKGREQLLRNAKAVGSTPIAGTRYSKACSDAGLFLFWSGLTLDVSSDLLRLVQNGPMSRRIAVVCLPRTRILRIGTIAAKRGRDTCWLLNLMISQFRLISHTYIITGYTYSSRAENRR